MATGPQHYAEAERLLADVLNPSTGNPFDDDEVGIVRNSLKAAQVHATLALAAATAPISHRNVVDETAAWAEVIGTAPPHVRLAWWLDDGQENPGKPMLFTTYEAACHAGTVVYKSDNPFANVDSADALRWLGLEDADDDTREDVELVVGDHRTGIIVRPIRPKAES